MTSRQAILWALDIDSDTKLMAIGGEYDFLKVFDTETLEEKKSIPLSNTITNVQWCPTQLGLLAVTSQSSGNNPMLYNYESLNMIQLIGTSEEGARALDWNRDGTLLAVGDNEGYLSLFSPEGALQRQIRLDARSLISLKWHPTEPIIAAVGADITLYHLETDSLVKVIPREKEVLQLCIDWHPSGAFFTTGDYGDQEAGLKPLLQFWDKSGTRIRSVEGSRREFRNMKWNADGTELATASDALRFWSVEGKLIRTYESDDVIWGLDWDEVDDVVITSNEIGQCQLWNFEMSEPVNFDF